MKRSASFSELFSDRAPYGCARGDDALWGRMKVLSKYKPWPSSVADIRATITDYFEKIVGLPLAGKEEYFVPALGTYGISGGKVQPAYWLDTAIPALEKEYLKRVAQSS